MAATDRDIFIDIGISIAKLLLIASGQGAIAAAVGEGAGLLAKFRRTLEIGGNRAVFAEKIADDAAKQLLREHEGISEADWHVATRQVASLIDRLSEKDRLAAGYNWEELRWTLLDLGGTDLRSSLADESAKQAFNWVLEVACRRISDCFTEKEALASLLEKVDEVRAGVQRLLDRPAGASQTDDVVNYHIKIVRDLAPDPLEDREQEIEELETFVRGSEDAWYALEASMVSGKTALMSSFALNPPDDVHIVSFFIRRIGGDGNDRESFALVMNAQLGNILGREYIEDVSEGRRPVEFHKLLRQAATACLSSAVPKTLVLVIDGIDEDSYFEKSDGQDAKSILSMLPKCLPCGVKVVTAARRNPRLPEDVQCDAKRRVVSLKPSPIAEKFINIKDIEKFFRTSTAVDIVAFLAACGDALTVKDLTKLLVMYRGWKILPHDVIMYVDRSPGRILDTVDISDCSQEVVAYRVGHDLVMQAVIRMLDPDSFGEGDEVGDMRRLAAIRDNALAPYRLTIREWVEECADRGWGCSTPSYVLSDPCFDLMLAGKEDVLRSAQIVFRRGRYEELKRRSGSRSSVLRTIDRGYFKVLELNCGEVPEGVLGALLGVAELRSHFARTGAYLPGLLEFYILHFNATPEVVLDLVLSIDDPIFRLGVLEGVVKVAIECGRAREFLSLLPVVVDSLASRRDVSDRSLRLLVDVLVSVGSVVDSSKVDGFDLEGWIKEIILSARMEEFFLSSCSSRRGGDEGSEDAHMIGPLHLAEDMAVRIEGPWLRVRALVEVADALVRVGDAEGARRVARNAANAAEQIEISWERAHALEEVVGALVRVGDTEGARRLARNTANAAKGIGRPLERARVLVEVADALARAGDTEGAQQVAGNAANAAKRIEEPRLSAGALACALVCTGHTGEGLATAQQIESSWERDRALVEMVGALVRVGDTEGARRLARNTANAAQQIESSWERDRALVKVVGALVRAGHTGEGLATAQQIESSWERAQALVEVADALARAGDTKGARRVARNAASAAKRIEEPWLSAGALACALVRVGDAEGARRLAGNAANAAQQIENFGERDWALVKVVGALVRAGYTGEGLATARQIESSWERDRALVEVAGALAHVGETDQTLMVISLINELSCRSRAQSVLMKELASKGSSNEAVNILQIALAEVGGYVHRQDSANSCAVLATACLDVVDLVDASSPMRERWLGLTRSVLARSWFYGASVWDNFDVLVRVAPELAVQLVDERILADPEQGTAPEPDPDLGPEGPGGEAGAYR